MNKALTIAALVGFAGAASAQLTITELYTGISGEDGTVDWIEVTNTSDAAVDTGGFFYDDSGPNLADAVALPSFVLNPGESAVILLEFAASNDDDFANSTDEFLTIWGFNAGDINLGVTVNDGGGLGQGSDGAFIGVDNGGVLDIVDGLEYPDGLAGDFFTIEDTNDGIRQSVLGENGAFETSQFFNDNIGDPANGFQVSLVGSPGVIPAPASAALLGLGGLAAIRRRR